jgi:hypothetical protein
VTFLFLFKRIYLPAFFYINLLILKKFLLIFLINHFQIFVALFLSLLDNVTLPSSVAFSKLQKFFPLVYFPIPLSEAIYPDNL